MNIEKLIAAAKEIDRLAQKQEDRSKELQKLASLARGAIGDRIELSRIQEQARMLGCTVVDFGDAINDLRRALRARPIKIIAPGGAGGV